MRLVIDTNIIVSALLSPDGTAFHVLSDVLDGKYILMIPGEEGNVKITTRGDLERFGKMVGG